MAAKHRAPDQPGDTTTTRGEPRRAPKPGERRPRKPSYRRSPIQIIPPQPLSRQTTREHRIVHVDPSGRPVGTSVRRGTDYESRRHRLGRAAATVAPEATEAARRAAIRSTAGGKPSVARHTAAGGAAGLATGAAIGTAVGGPVGTAVGAAGGTVLGAAGGAIGGRKAKRAYKAAMRADTAGPRRLLLAEFTLCAAITALSPLTDDKRNEPPTAFMKRFTALLALFFILGLVSAGGRGAAKVAAGFGGLVTVVLLVSKRDLLVKITQIMNTSKGDSVTTRGVRPAGVGS